MARQRSLPTESRRVWLCVLKTCDLVGPRRHPERPRVVVKSLPTRPGLDLDRWVKTSRRAKRMRVVNVVYEAMPAAGQPGGRDQPFLSPSQRDTIKAAEKRLRQRLRCDGYTVNGDLSVWHLYVIELSPPSEGVSSLSVVGHLYVGQTSQLLETASASTGKGIARFVASGSTARPAIGGSFVPALTSCPRSSRRRFSVRRMPSWPRLTCELRLNQRAMWSRGAPSSLKNGEWTWGWGSKQGAASTPQNAVRVRDG